MSLADKLKQGRAAAGLSQSELADKLCVSRQAITKWESGNGTPDIENLQAIAHLFNVSVDYLLDKSDMPAAATTQEVPNPVEIKAAGGLFKWAEQTIVDRYPNAAIHQVVNAKHLSWPAQILDFFVGAGTLEVADAVTGKEIRTPWFLVEDGTRQLLVGFSDQAITSRELNGAFTGKHLVLDGRRYSKTRTVQAK